MTLRCIVQRCKCSYMWRSTIIILNDLKQTCAIHDFGGCECLAHGLITVRLSRVKTRHKYVCDTHSLQVTWIHSLDARRKQVLLLTFNDPKHTHTYVSLVASNLAKTMRGSSTSFADDAFHVAIYLLWCYKLLSKHNSTEKYIKKWSHTI